MSKSNFKENLQPTQERKANKEKEPLDNTTKLKSRQKKIPSDSKRKSSIGNENANIFEPKEEIIEAKENEENKVDSTEENIINLINESDKVNYLYNSKKNPKILTLIKIMLFFQIVALELKGIIIEILMMAMLILAKKINNVSL